MNTSKAHMRRLAAGFAARVDTLPELSAPIAEAISTYVPRPHDEPAWAAVGPTHRDIMRKSGYRSEQTLIRAQSVCSGYLLWRYRSGHPLDIAESMTFTGIDEYYRLSLIDLRAEKSANDYRSRLRRLAQIVNPGVTAPTIATVGYRPVRPGYNPVEEAVIKRTALRQRNTIGRRKLCAVVGLSAGAGLAPGDYRELRSDHIANHADDGISVEIGGDMARTVWVRHEYEELVLAGIEGLQPHTLVLGKSVTRRNITTRATEHADLYDCDEIDASRLRSTWLTWVMCQPIPLALVLDAAGLKTVRTLADLAPSLSDTPVDPAILRGRS